MPETEQATTETTDWKAKYDELQPEFTRRSQQLAEIERQRRDGELVEKASYDEFVKKWANEDPAAAQDWLGWNQQPSAGGVEAGLGQNDRYGEVDDSIYDPQSELSQSVVRRFGEEGLRQAQLSRMAPELLSATGLDRQVAELLERDKQREEELVALREQAQQAQQYAVSAYDKSSLLEDPRLKDVREIHKRLSEDKSQWFDVVQKIKRVDELEAKIKEVEARRGTSSAQPQPTESAEQAAARIDQAGVVPQGAGSGAGDVPSQALDPFDAAVLKADPAVAARLGITAA